MKILIYVFIIITSLLQFAYAEDLPDTAWTRSFDPESVVDAKFSPDDSLIYVATSGGVYSVETKTGNVLRKYETIPGEVYALDISKDGTKLAVAHHKQVIIFNAFSGDTIDIINENTAIVDVAISPDKRYLAYLPTEKIGDSTYFFIYDIDLRMKDKKITKKGESFRFIRYSNEGLKAVTVQWTLNQGQSAGGVIGVWNTQTWEMKIIGSHSAHVQDLKISPDGKYAATAALDSTAMVWDIEQGKLVRQIKPQSNSENAWCVDFSIDNNFLLTGAGGPFYSPIKVWNLNDGSFQYEFKQPVNGNFVNVSNKNKHIVTGGGRVIFLLNAKWDETPVLENIINNQPDTKTIPTPFSETVKIEFNLPKAGIVKAFISNEAGESVYVFPEKFFTEGKNTLEWKPNNMPQGVYFCNIRCDEVSLNVKLLLQN